MIKRIFLSFLAVSLLAAAGFAEEVKLTAQARPVVTVGETFTIVYTLNAQGSGFRGPAMRGLDLLSGPNTSTSSSVRMMNGTTTMTITYTFTYLVQANREGTIDIGPATVTADGRQYTSNSLSIKVVKGNAQAGSQGQGAQGGKGQQGASGVGSNDVYVKAIASNVSPMQGEATVVTYKIYTKVPIAQINISKLSSFSGFWSQNLMKENDKLQQTTEVINGEQYVVADIRKVALFPLKSGRLAIDPLELNCVAQVRKQTKTRTGDPFFDDFFNDSFFNSGVANVEKTLKSNPLVINVRPLPEEGKPADFSGAVGTFTFHSEVDNTRLKTNDALNLKCTITGRGNLQLIDKLNVTFPPDFETYDPKVTSDIQTTAAGITGSQVFEYLMIPRKPGKFVLKPVTFSFFDLEKKKYVTLSSPQFNLEVEKGSGDQGAAMTYSGAGKEEIKYIGSDIRHIREKISLEKAGAGFFLSVSYWLLLLLPLIAFAVFLVLWRKLAARRSDTVLMKNRKATKVAQKRLQKAEQFRKAGDHDNFYVAISQALWGYLSDKFGIPPAELSMDSVHEALSQRNVSDTLINRFTETINNTEFSRFAPGEKNHNMEVIYNEALGILSTMERELR